MAPETKVPTGVVFDVDGTLIDTYRLYIEAYRRAIAEFVGYLPSREEIRLGRPSAERLYLEKWVGAEGADACHERFCAHYRELHPAWFDGVYDGVREMLSGLRSAGLPLALVTGKGRKAWEISTEILDLGKFEVVITEDEMEAPKPDPGGLLAAAGTLKLDPSDLVYVGDSLGDIEAARTAGMLSAAVLWPKTDPADRQGFLSAIEAQPPDWTFERPADLVRTFAPWC